MESGDVRLLKPAGERTRPYGIRIDSEGRPWVNLFGTNRIVNIDPATMQMRNLPTPR